MGYTPMVESLGTVHGLLLVFSGVFSAFLMPLEVEWATHFRAVLDGISPFVPCEMCSFPPEKDGVPVSAR